KADALRAAGLGKNRGINAHQVAVGIHQRTARVAGVNCGVSLDEVFVGVEAQLIAPGGADNAHGHRLTDAKGIADGQADVADADIVRAPESNEGQVWQVDLQHGEVGFRVAANQPSQGFAAIFQRYD